MGAGANRRPPLLAVVILSAIVGMVGGAASAWAVYHEVGGSPRVAGTGGAPAAGGSLSPDAIAEQVGPSIVKVVTRPLDAAALQGDPAGLATGFVVSSDGLVVTSTHALRGATTLRVATSDGHRYEATLAGKDLLHGVAVLRVVRPEGAKDLTPLRFAERRPAVGQFAVAVGAPPFATVGVTPGTVGATERSVSEAGGGVGSGLVDAITVQAVSDPRDDGSPLVDGSGAVIGVVSAGTHPGVPGLVAGSGRAAAALVERAARGSAAGGSTFGAQAIVLDPATAAAAGVPAGALIRTVDAAGPAAGALRPGDIVTAVNGRPVEAAHPLDPASFGVDPGQPVTLTVVRGGAPQSVTVTVTAG